MKKILRLSQVEEGFRGKVAFVDAEDTTYIYYNDGFYPGNEVNLIKWVGEEALLRLGRYIKKYSREFLDKVYVVELDEVPFID